MYVCERERETVRERERERERKREREETVKVATEREGRRGRIMYNIFYTYIDI